MAKTYDISLLASHDPSSLAYARTVVRTLLRDKPDVQAGGVPNQLGQPVRPNTPVWPEFGREDEEINAALTLDAATERLSDNTLRSWCRPYFTAARLYLGDPALWRSRAVDGSSESRRDSREIVDAWLAQGAALDRLIPEVLWPLPVFYQEAAAAGAPTYRPRIAGRRTVL